MERLKSFEVKLYCTDKWEAYAKELPIERLVQSKAETVAIERNNSDNRHWFARFHRRTKVVSHSLKMVDLTMALFARFRVNGSVIPLRNWILPLYG